MATIKDVAKKAGVSIGVVSRAFNNYPDISEETKKRIFEVAKELNYTPNIVARNLSMKKQMTIGLITSGILDSSPKDSNNSLEIFKGVYTGTQEKNYELAIYLIDSQKQRGKKYVQFCRERNIGGAILQGIRTDDPYLQELVEANIPCVLIDAALDTDEDYIGFVSTDNVAAIREVALHLLENNHRDIVVVAGKKEAYVDEWRLQGVREAFREFGFTLSADKIIYGDYTEQGAYEAAKILLQNMQPTAFLCFSDLMALGVMKAVEEAGLAVPNDISVTGFDGLIITEYTQPPLTTVWQNFFEIGRQAANLLIQLMEKKETERHILVNHELIKRGSVARLEKDRKEEE